MFVGVDCVLKRQTRKWVKRRGFTRVQIGSFATTPRSGVHRFDDGSICRDPNYVMVGFPGYPSIDVPGLRPAVAVIKPNLDWWGVAPCAISNWSLLPVAYDRTK